MQKSILERAGPPTFDVAVEMLERNKWRVHLDVAQVSGSARGGAGGGAWGGSAGWGRGGPHRVSTGGGMWH